MIGYIEYIWRTTYVVSYLSTNITKKETKRGESDL